MSDRPKEPCRRCLLAQTDQADVIAEVRRAIGRLKPSEKADGQEYERRLAFCEACDELIDGCCMKCGCYVELRAALKSGRCPLAGKRRKW